MGADWYSCKSCGRTFPDCGDYTGCECGEHWCCDECAESDGYKYEEEGFTPEGSRWAQETSCNFCRGEDVEDWELLSFALNKLDVSRNELIKQFKESK